MHDLESARAESAELLNLDPDRLAPAQTLKCDSVSALRLVIDDELARATSGSGADLSKLIVAVDHLTTFMKDARPAEVEPDPYEGIDPHKHLEELVTRYFAAKEAERAEKAAERRKQGLSEAFGDLDAAQARIDELEARLAEFEVGNSPKGLPSPNAKVITPSESDITPPGDPVIDGLIPSKPAPPKRTQPGSISEAEARAQGLRLARHDEPWRGYTHIFE